MTKPDLMAELADKWDAMAADARKKGEHGMSNAYEDCAEELRTHHAELESAVRDASDLRELAGSWRVLGRINGSSLARDAYRICANQLEAAMHNSAREG